jgi:hypothetical protein
MLQESANQFNEENIPATGQITGFYDKRYDFSEWMSRDYIKSPKKNCMDMHGIVPNIFFQSSIPYFFK